MDPKLKKSVKSVDLGDVRILEQFAPDLYREMLASIDFRVPLFQSPEFKDALRSARGRTFGVLEKLLSSDQLVEQKRILAQVDRYLQMVKADPASGHDHTLKDKIKKANKLGVDVSDVEAQLPELLQTVARVEVDRYLQMVKADPASSHHHTLQDKIKKANKLGVDVSDVEAQLPELLQRVEGAKSNPST